MSVPTENEPDNMRELTRACAEAHIDEFKDNSIFLGIFPLNQRLNTDIALQLIKQKNLESKTLGIFTKCDEVNSEIVEEMIRAKIDQKVQLLL